MVPDRYVRAADFADQPARQQPGLEDRGASTKVARRCPMARSVSAGARTAATDQAVEPRSQGRPRRQGSKLMLSCSRTKPTATKRARRPSPTLAASRTRTSPTTRRTNVAARAGAGALGDRDGEQRDVMVATVFDLQAASTYGDRGLPGGRERGRRLRRRRALHACLAEGSPACRATRSSPWPASSPTTPTRRKASMVIIGAGMNHWYHCDMNYRGIINMLMMCGCIGKSGGGWSHYAGQEKSCAANRLDGAGLRPGLDPPAAPDERHQLLLRPHRPVALRKLGMDEILSPWPTRPPTTAA